MGFTLLLQIFAFCALGFGRALNVENAEKKRRE